MAQLAYNPRWLLLEGVEGKSELVNKYRATMHIDMVPEFQGQGWGRKLIESFVDSVRYSGAEYGRGIHIGVSGQNTKVVPFYEKLLFRVYEGGEKEGNVWMVRDV
jgi:GNAT superfamily N-acetyltransferase